MKYISCKGWLSLIFFLYFSPNTAQVVNAYAKVVSISDTVLSLSNVNETNHTFIVGENIIIMQMQDDVIGSNTNNDSGFGNLSSISSAGQFEVKTIVAITSTSLTVNSALINTYNTGLNSSVQIISFRQLSSTDYTTTASMTALDWDGNVGGVIAIHVGGVLTLKHSITANGAGFRGGAFSNVSPILDCDASWITGSDDLGGEKGEGIYKRTAAGQRYSRAKMLNGGGGGNRHNAGGGGGGNVSAGGEGGPGYNCTATPVSGQGGVSLNAHISANRIFMGGGGGGGHQNDLSGSAGGDGGGIILIKATQIITTGTCSGITIAADAIDAANSNNDGAGGGGAGGTIVFDASSFDVKASCPVNAYANGSNGGRITNIDTHGGGGGGGQGAILFPGTAPSNVEVSTANGTGGCNDSSSPCTNQAGAASGSSGAGIKTNVGDTPLPISLLYFAGTFTADTPGHIDLDWATSSELNNSFFSLERSKEGKEFTLIGTVPGMGNSEVIHNYHWEDNDILNNRYYYRLSQTDFDGTKTILKIIVVNINAESMLSQVWVYPNPAKQSDYLNLDFGSMRLGTYSIKLVNIQGVIIAESQVNITRGFQSEKISLTGVTPGLYLIRISSAQESKYIKVLIKN